MPYRLTKIYTRKGDKGYTHLAGQRLFKDEPLVEILGTLDELNSMLGLVLSQPIQHASLSAFLTHIQHDLFNMGGELHVPEHIVITEEKIGELEKQLDEWNANLPPLKEFLLPRGNTASAACHVARTICRRAERGLVHLHRQSPLSNPHMLASLNRLSDLLFVAARLLAQESREPEILWEHERK
jgi:cob(I)alamin adenosyltransferase